MPILNRSNVLTATMYSFRVCAGILRLTMRLTLFQRDDCRLCDLALEVLAHARVPVLRNEDSGCELNWPFDADALREFLGG